MVLIRYGDESVTKTAGGKGRVTLIYIEDSVWSMYKEAYARAKQLEEGGYFTNLSEKRFTNAPDEHTVWRSMTKRKGTRHAKKKFERETRQEGIGEKPKFKQSTKYKYIKK